MSPEFNKYHYSAFGMDIHSEFKLALPLANATTPKDWPVEILHEPVSIPSPLPYSFNNNERIRYGRVGDDILINIETIARIAIRGNTTILCDPYPGSSEKMLSICIVGIALVVLLKQRKLFLLHGSAVTGMNGTFAFIGNRGAGKSTTAAALSHHGYKVLCDDIIPIVPGPLIMPGVPFVNLLPDAYERLIGNPDDAQGSFNGVDKFSVQLPASTHQEPPHCHLHS